jgi:heat shock protein HslJ
MKTLTTFALVVASALLVGACYASPGTSPTPSPSANGSGSLPPGQGAVPAGLEGRTFLATGITGRALVPGSQVRLAFQGGQVSATAGCNSMSGAYSLANGMLIAGQLATTEMACDPPLMAQDRWLAELLGGAGVTLAGDTLTLERSGMVLTLVDREVADPDRPLEGTRWVVDGIVAGDAVSSVPAGVTAAITISEGQVSVEAGCNTGGGTVEVADGTLTFGPIALTKMACAQDAMAVEQAVVAALTGRVAYTVEAGILTLGADDAGLVLRASP